jgi:hypothetical protein
MATPPCDKNGLLTVFADNTTQNITPADLRLFVTCIYDNFLDISNIIDNNDTYAPDMALSANMGAQLEDKVNDNNDNISTLERDKADANIVYTKAESDSRYYTQTQIDSNVALKSEIYTKQEIDNAMAAIEQSILVLSARIDCLANEIGSPC